MTSCYEKNKDCVYFNPLKTPEGKEQLEVIDYVNTSPLIKPLVRIDDLVVLKPHLRCLTDPYLSDIKDKWLEDQVSFSFLNRVLLLRNLNANLFSSTLI